MVIKVLNDETEAIDGHQKTKVGKTVTVEAGDQITLRCGQSEVVMKKDGTITIKGSQITVEGSVKNTVKSPLIDVNASAVATVKGGIVKIN